MVERVLRKVGAESKPRKQRVKDMSKKDPVENQTDTGDPDKRRQFQKEKIEDHINQKSDSS